ncbi:MAG TPA: HAMP domain-containing sensor histidine kinase [Gemmatimonadaceae bacterium]|nr:HAMP domain-containing sensor histidine kinase [Gemmatimonadaceae bacterium]
MNTSTSSLSRAGIGLFSTLLAAVLMLMVGALLTADRALVSASGDATAIDARDSALLIEQLLALRIDALTAFHSPLMAPPAERSREFEELAGHIGNEPGGPGGLWVTDSTGQVIYQTESPPPPRAAPPQSTSVVVENAHGVRALIVVAPLIANGRPIGAVGARFDPAALFTVAIDSAPQTRARFVVAAGADTVLSVTSPAARQSLTWRHAHVHVPGATWSLTVAHTQTSQALRLTLWTLGLAAVLVLGGGVLRERRQALRVAERSAELERLSSELLRANRMKSEFLANVSHELRTPLNAIVGFVDLLRDGVYGDLNPRQAPPVERIAASATHLRHLVDQVLDIAKIAAGRLEVHAETIVLRPFVLNVVSELEPLITERGLTLSIAVGASLPRVRTDPTHLRQILVNLIGNAIKYTPAGGIAVRARMTGLPVAANGRHPSPEDPTLLSRSPDRRKAWIALQVIDTGIGISPSDQERIFDEFEQVNAGPRSDSMERGTGLGLAISRRLARLLGGEISVDSQPGKGSTFTVWLPLSPADVTSESADSPDAPEQAAV